MSRPAPDLYLLVVAHPDDESMFFVPTLHALLERQRRQQRTQQPNGGTPPIIPSVHVLSLSNGNYDGLGKLREAELRRAGRILGLSSGGGPAGAGAVAINNTVEVLDVEDMRDGPDERWDAGAVAGAVWDHIVGIVRSEERATTAAAPNGRDGEDAALARPRCVSVVTFDGGGVSGHPNHVDVCRGVRCLLGTRSSRRGWRREGASGSIRGGGDGANAAPDPDVTIRVWELDTVTNPLAKYCPVLEWVLMVLEFILSMILAFLGLRSRRGRGDDVGSAKRFGMGSGVTYRMFRPLLVWNAMAAHRSQFVWYRRLSVLFSRYTYANTLREVGLPSDWTGTVDRKKQG